jgi:hypothetical protein
MLRPYERNAILWHDASWGDRIPHIWNVLGTFRCCQGRMPEAQIRVLWPLTARDVVSLMPLMGIAISP